MKIKTILLTLLFLTTIYTLRPQPVLADIACSGWFDCLLKKTFSFIYEKGEPNVTKTLSFQCGDTISDIKSDPDPKDNNRNGGKPIVCCLDPKEDKCKSELDKILLSQPIIYTGTISEDFWYDENNTVIPYVTQRSVPRGFAWGGWLYNLIVDSTTPKDEQDNTTGTLSGVWSGQMYQKNTELRINCRANKNIESCQDLDYKLSTADEKLGLELMAPDGKIKNANDANREWLLVKILSGYQKSITKRENPTQYPFGQSFENIDSKYEPYHDYVAAYLANDGFHYDKVSNSRPFYGIELICRKTDFTPKGIARSTINSICSKVMGANYASGVISTGSYLATALNNNISIKNPSNDCVFNSSPGCGAWERLPPYGNEDYVAQICEEVEKGEYDPPGQPGQTGNPRCTMITLPVGAVTEISKKLQDVFSTQDMLEKNAANNDYAIDQRSAKGVAFRRPVQIGGNGLQELNYTIGTKIDPGKTTLNPTINPNNYTFAPIPDEFNPQPSASARPANWKKIVENRTVTYTFYAPKKLVEFMKSTSGSQGFTRNFLPSEITQNIDLPLGGVKISQQPTQAEVSATGRVSLPNAKGITPLVGGPVFVEDIQRSLLTNYNDQWSRDKQNAGVTLKNLASQSDDKQLSQTPWDKLASFGKNLLDNLNVAKN